MPDLDRTASAHPYLVEKVESGETGASVGRGFREWAPGSAEDLRANVTEKLIERRRRQLQESDDSRAATPFSSSGGQRGPDR